MLGIVKYFLYILVMSENVEIWKPVVGYEGLYEVSSYGRVRSFKQKSNGKILKAFKDTGGYWRVCLNTKEQHSVHRLVAQAFIPNPNNLPMVNHKDENKANNIVWVNDDGSIDYDKSNLEWCDAKYNCNYGTLQERRVRKVFKPILQYTKNGVFLKEWESIISAAQQTNISRKHISDCCCGRGKTAGGYIWKHKEVA